MVKLSYEELVLLIEQITGAGVFDYISLFISSFVTLLAVSMSYFFFKNHSNQIKNEKVIEKEVEKLYEAVDCLFEFTNATDLYLSMKEKSIQRILNGIAIEGEFQTKSENATENVFQKFKYAHKSSFILRALGEKDASSLIDVYRSDMINIRKSIYDAENKFNSDGDTSELEKISKKIGRYRAKLDKQRDSCVDEVASCKTRIKSVA